MKGTISQMITLTSAANGVLAGRFSPDSFYPSHADFKFCNAVRFVDLKKNLLGKVREVERYKDPNQWLAALPAQDTTRAWLTYTPQNDPIAPDHQLAAFVGGGGTWQLVVEMELRIEFWQSRWEVTNQGAPDDRIWGVKYGCVYNGPAQLQMPDPDLASAEARLLTALSAIHAFAVEHDLPTWADWFHSALAVLNQTDAVGFPDYVDFVCLDSYPDVAQRLFAAAYRGWVFGGMGWWNDLGFEPETEQKRYEALTSDLYSAITDAIQRATWSFRFEESS